LNEIIINLLILAVSLVVIIVSSDKLIDSCSKIARFYGVPVFIIGVSIIAFGTSAPELVVGILSSIDKSNSLSFGNIVGSCINNVGLILSIASFIVAVKVDEKILKKEMLMLTGVEIILIIMASMGGLTRVNGIILLILGIAFIIYLIKGTQNPEQEYSDEDMKIDKKELPKHWITIIIGLAGLILSGQFIVTSSTGIASALNIEQSAIGLTLIALGTTMPELVTTIAAARRKEDDIILGNIIGSNIFNILIVLGSAALIYPIEITFITENIFNSLAFDMFIMFGLNIFLYLTMLKNRNVNWKGGIVLIFIYVAYMSKQIYFMMPHA